MATGTATHPLDPSAYIAQHLQDFSTVPAAPFEPDYSHDLIWLAAALAIALACLWFTEGRAMFRMVPPMPARRRLAVWLSCAWRYWALRTSLEIVAGLLQMLAFSHVGFLLGAPAALLPSHLLSFDLRPWQPAFQLTGIASALLVPLLLAALVSLPLAGYVTQKGFAARGLATGSSLTFPQAIVLGWTTCFWSELGVMFVRAITPPMVRHALSGLQLLALVPWGMYVVLPRQARHIARAAPADPHSPDGRAKR